MNSITKKWVVKQEEDPIPDEVYYNLNGYHETMRQILYNRGITDRESAEEFIYALPPTDLTYQSMKGISESVERIQWAIRNQEPIAIYGD